MRTLGRTRPLTQSKAGRAGRGVREERDVRDERGGGRVVDYLIGIIVKGGGGGGGLDWDWIRWFRVRVYCRIGMIDKVDMIG